MLTSVIYTLTNKLEALLILRITQLFSNLEQTLKQNATGFSCYFPYNLKYWPHRN